MPVGQGKIMIRILIIAIAFCIAGCIPLIQQDTTIITAMSAFYDDGSGHLIVTFLPEIYETNPEIIDELSYAVGPDRKKYKLKHGKHQFDIEQRYKIARDSVYLLDDKGRVKTSLENGIWRLTITTKDMKNRVQDWDTEFKLWTFWYSPFIHGAPN